MPEHKSALSALITNRYDKLLTRIIDMVIAFGTFLDGFLVSSAILADQ